MLTLSNRKLLSLSAFEMIVVVLEAIEISFTVRSLMLRAETKRTPHVYIATYIYHTLQQQIWILVQQNLSQ